MFKKILTKISDFFTASDDNDGNYNSKNKGRFSNRKRRKIVNEISQIHGKKIEQFNDVISNKMNFLTTINNLKIPVYFKTHFKLSDPAFDSVKAKIDKAIENRVPIIFGDWVLSWKESKEIYIPEIVDLENIDSSTYILNLSNEGTREEILVFKTICDYINLLIDEKNALFFFNDEFVILKRADNKKITLFGEKFIHANI
ncbi:MSC_0623 family F1-like ATPase-associated protein [Mycoplasmopsis agassizii]|uniref:Uncharacterized protein n=1 Tax=Mycoplasmopsis agassizii TaxID=33922 RepID=A0ABX4H5G4_9BACT|nr:DUF2714 domain-containing protein [Mycoplasmopsis agassizii]PAF55126.1 hypothetical protein CJF60_00360 [Mycoplasmopsis agassizii]SMC16642.1 Protein of unknown function [Mycoplasmopsis agassizii]